MDRKRGSRCSVGFRKLASGRNVGGTGVEQRVTAGTVDSLVQRKRSSLGSRAQHVACLCGYSPAMPMQQLISMRNAPS
jgi:hypothetical protein